MSVSYHFQHFTDGDVTSFPRQLLLDAIAPWLVGSNDEFACLEVHTIGESIFCDNDDDIDGFMVSRPGGEELYAAMLPLLQGLNLIWIMEDGTLLHAMDDFERHVPSDMIEDFIIAKVASVPEIRTFIEESGSLATGDSAFNDGE